ncbi:hypothetical protein BMS3Bbin02_00936 [bacterium BMS3Bbin02]|nr:hypothetical protein BMS3Bbin02_00936 [bacterium BMS3Bbin02]
MYIDAVRKVALAFLLLVAACGSAAAAPVVGVLETVCVDAFCVDVPQGWTVSDQGASFLVLVNPADQDAVITIAPMNMEGVATAGGRVWPISKSEFVAVMWAVVDDGRAEVRSVEPQLDGSIDSYVVLPNGYAWHRLVTVDSPRAFSIELRAPDRSWQEHADAVRQSFRTNG